MKRGNGPGCYALYQRGGPSLTTIQSQFLADILLVSCGLGKQEGRIVERTIKSQEIFAGRIVRLSVDTVELPSGHQTTREVVEHPGAVGILPVMDDGRFVLVKQYRYATKRELLEVPAGTREPNEDAETCARRELGEETGFQATTLTPLARFFVSPGWCDEEIIIYLARGLSAVDVSSEEDEDLAVHIIEPAAALERIAQGEIADAKTMTAIYAYLQLGQQA